MESDVHRGVTLWLPTSETLYREPSLLRKTLLASPETESGSPARRSALLGEIQTEMRAQIPVTCPSPQRALRRSPVADTGFVCGICLLGGKSDVGHFPSREKHNNTRKRQALWECSKWELQPRPEHKQRRTSLEVRPSSAEAESRGQSSDTEKTLL